MDEIEHTADRPTWYCRICHDEWPCEPARKELLNTHSPTRLAALMWCYLETAAFEMPTMPVGDFFRRFVSWTWPHQPPA